jgi:hypothetical protein
LGTDHGSGDCRSPDDQIQAGEALRIIALIPFLADSFSSIICDSNKDTDGFGTTVAIGSGPWAFESWTKATGSF